MTTKTALEFFAGIGLARMGLEAAGWTVAFANDNDPKKREMYSRQFGDSEYSTESVFELTVEQLPNAELAWASFPCIDLSLAGNRAGLAGQDSSTYWGFYSLLLQKAEAALPSFIVIENVTGIITSRGGSDLATVMQSLADLGYRSDVLVVDAAHFVPQSRPRVFLVAALGDSMPSRVAPITVDTLHPISLVKFAERHPGLPWGHAPVGELPSKRAPLIDVLEEFPSNADIWWSRDETERLLEMMPAQHRARVSVLADTDQRSVATIYRRIRPHGYVAEVRFDGLAGCLRTARGGSSRQFVLDVDRGTIRARHMTPREYARLQGAGSYKFGVRTNQAINGFGDAVCVPVVTWLANETIEPLRSESSSIATRPTQPLLAN